MFVFKWRRDVDFNESAARTTGKDIFFNAGRHTSDTYNGKKLLAHELTHVMQQSTGSESKIQLSSGDATDSPGNVDEICNDLRSAL